MVPIDLSVSSGYAPPPIANPFLFGAIKCKNVLAELSLDTSDRALPVFALNISYTS